MRSLARQRRRKAGRGSPAPVADGEIIANPRDLKTCQQCHNEKSPTFKPFCLKERMNKIQHFDPRKKRTPKEIKALEATCSEGCKICAEKKKKAEKKD